MMTAIRLDKGRPFFELGGAGCEGGLAGKEGGKVVVAVECEGGGDDGAGGRFDCHGLAL